jgi:hypothetical protein
VTSANPDSLLLKLFRGEYGETKKVTIMNGAATKNGKFRGNELYEKNGMMKGRFPIIMWRTFREEF